MWVRLPSLDYIDYLLQSKAGQWVVVDSSMNTNYRGLWMSPEGNLYTGGYGVSRWEGSHWNWIFREITVIGIGGTSDNNFFVVGASSAGGEVYHFNGVDWFQFQNLQLWDVLYTDIWTDNKEVFIVGYTFNYPQKTIILHGK